MSFTMNWIFDKIEAELKKNDDTGDRIKYLYFQKNEYDSDLDRKSVV